SSYPRARERRQCKAAFSSHSGTNICGSLRRQRHRGRRRQPVLYLIILCGLISVAYGVWSTREVLAADAGSARMQEIAAAIREGATAYLRRQYTTVAGVGVVIF